MSETRTACQELAYIERRLFKGASLDKASRLKGEERRIYKHLDVDVREYMDQSSLIRQFGNKIWYFHFNIVYLHSKMNQ